MDAIVEMIVNLPVEDILNIDMNLEQKIAREFLECQICMDRCKNPKDLQCRHFFCEECLTQLVAKDKTSITTIKCPTCRKFTPIPENGGIADLPSNFYVSSLADVVKRTANASDETSDKESPRSPRESPPKIEMKTCTKHSGKELGMVCMTCMEIICYVCMMESHQQPEHKCKLFQKAIEESKQSLTSFQEQLSVSASRGQRYLDAIEENRGILNDNATQVLQAIQTSTTETIRAIYSRSDELIKDVKKIQDGVDNELSDLSDVLTTRVEDIMNKLDTIETVLKKKEDIDIISCSTVMEECDPSCMKFKSVPDKINFVQFMKQELGDEGGLGTLQPLQIVIIGRDDLRDDDNSKEIDNNDNDNDDDDDDDDGDEYDDYDDDDTKTDNGSEKEKSILIDQNGIDGGHEQYGWDGVNNHRINYDSRCSVQLAGQDAGKSQLNAIASQHQGQGFPYHSVPMAPTASVNPMVPETNPYCAATQPPHPHGPPVASAPGVYNGPPTLPSYGPTSMAPVPYIYGRPTQTYNGPTQMAHVQGTFRTPAVQHQRMNYPVMFAPRCPGPMPSNIPRGACYFRPANGPEHVPMGRPQAHMMLMRQPYASPQSQQYARYPGNPPNRRVVPYQQEGGNTQQQMSHRAAFFTGAPLMPVTQHALPDFMEKMPETAGGGPSPFVPTTSPTVPVSETTLPSHGQASTGGPSRMEPGSPTSDVGSINADAIKNASEPVEQDTASDLQGGSSICSDSSTSNKSNNDNNNIINISSNSSSGDANNNDDDTNSARRRPRTPESPTQCGRPPEQNSED